MLFACCTDSERTHCGFEKALDFVDIPLPKQRVCPCPRKHPDSHIQAWSMYSISPWLPAHSCAISPAPQAGTSSYHSVQTLTP